MVRSPSQSLIARLFSHTQAGAPLKDVTFPDNPATKSLLLEKHADYIVAFEKDKDDLVCSVHPLSLPPSLSLPPPLSPSLRSTAAQSS